MRALSTSVHNHDVTGYLPAAKSQVDADGRWTGSWPEYIAKYGVPPRAVLTDEMRGHATQTAIRDAAEAMAEAIMNHDWGIAEPGELRAALDRWQELVGE